MSEDENNPETGATTPPEERSPETAETPVDPVAFDAFGNAESAGGGPTLPRALLDPISLTLSVELGRTRLTFRELQALTQGAMVELDHLVGDPLEIRANGHLVARGEVVAVKQEHYGVRITEIVQPNRTSEDAS